MWGANVLVFIIVGVAIPTAFNPDLNLTNEQTNEGSFNLTVLNFRAASSNYAILCDPNYPYRSINGSCNNLRNPHWGMSKTPYARLLPNNYGDGKYAMPISVSGAPLSLARLVSNVVNPIGNRNDFRHTLGLMQFGQIVAHDLSFTGFGKDFGKGTVECCVDGQFGPDINSPRCETINTPDNDPVFSQVGYKCLPFERTVTTRDIGITNENEVADPITVVTGYFDLSNVYGPTDDVARHIRTFRDGRLKTANRHGQSFLQNAENSTVICRTPDPHHVPCYEGGDVRLNQNPQLTLLQTTLMREHNNIADILALLNPQWDDERVYQEARRINIGSYQKFVYHEYIPRIIGSQYAEDIGILYPHQHGCVDDYDDVVDASAVVESASAALRALHSQIAGSLNFFNEDRRKVGAIKISDHLNKNDVLEESVNNNTCDLNFDYLSRGLTYQPTKYNDKYFVGQIKHYLFKGPSGFGQDLRAIDLQRERDHGVGTYVEALSYCNLPVPRDFDDLRDLMPSEDIANLRKVYADVRDVSLSSGGLLEYPAPGALVGPTYQCLLGVEFRRARTGDRFFYENCNAGFSQEQLLVIRQASFACHLCRNSYCVDRMQPQAFDPVSSTNQLQDCAHLCRLDLTPWQERRESA